MTRILYIPRVLPMDFLYKVKTHQDTTMLQGNLSNKEGLWRSYKKFQTAFGKQNFDFELETFVLPEETESLKEAWNSSNLWIIKPFHV